MLKAITRTILTSTMSFAWTLIRADERATETTQGWGSDERASFAEKTVQKTGKAITAMGERLELATNGRAMRLGYR